ncbi:MAG: hypothetical protein II633_07675 [Bacteroidales bacterium]|nr:hypothetical protein [Bacteroidales bacterium]
MKRLILLSLVFLPIFVYGQRPVVTRLGNWVDDSVQLKGPMQGLAVYGRYAVALRHGGQCLLLDLRKKSCIAAFQLEGNTTHCNNDGAPYFPCFSRPPRYRPSRCHCARQGSGR